MTKLLTMTAITLTIMAGATAAQASTDTHQRHNQQTMQGEPSPATHTRGQNYTQGQLHPTTDWAQDARAGVNAQTDEYVSSEKSARQRNTLISSTGLNGNYGVWSDSVGNVINSDRMSTKDRYGSVGASNSIEMRRAHTQQQPHETR